MSTTIETIQAMTVYSLAAELGNELAGGPDAEDSPGAKWLDGVRTAVVEQIQWLAQNNDGDVIAAAKALLEDHHEQADSAVEVYTSTRWEVFAELGMWQVDVEDLGSVSDMTEAAGRCQYEAAGMLIRALCEALVEDAPEEPEEEADGLDVVVDRFIAEGYLTYREEPAGYVYVMLGIPGRPSAASLHVDGQGGAVPEVGGRYDVGVYVSDEAVEPEVMHSGLDLDEVVALAARERAARAL